MFDLQAQDGFTPLKVLQVTTLAQSLQREASNARVEEGKNAKLVVLDGNPIKSVANLHKLNAVIRGGKYYSKDALEGLKKNVQDDMAEPQAAACPSKGLNRTPARTKEIP